MAEEASEERAEWSGALGFILAAVGSAVGLGNVWRFPYVAAENGGGAFVLMYLGFIAIIGLPLLIGEMKMGRRSQRGPVGAYSRLAERAGSSRIWIVFGAFAVITGFVLLSYYSVVGGWSLAYTLFSVTGEVSSVSGSEAAEDMFKALKGEWWKLAIGHGAFMGVTIGIVYGGISDGIERAARLLMPTLGVLLVALLGYSVTLQGAGEALSFMFAPKWSDVTTASVLQAMGQSAFTLSLGMGAIIVYGSYLDDEDDLYGPSLAVAGADTFVAIASGVVVFSIIFSQAPDPEKLEFVGPGLVFETLPQLFGTMPGGFLVSILFFTLLTFAAVSSALSLMEVVTSYFIEEQGFSRPQAVLLFGTAIFFLGFPTLLGFNVLSDVTLNLGGSSKNILGILDYLVVNYALPLGGLGVGVFAGWVVDPSEWRDEVGDEPLARLLIPGWIWLVRTVAPIAIVLLLLSKFGLFG